MRTTWLRSNEVTRFAVGTGRDTVAASRHRFDSHAANYAHHANRFRGQTRALCIDRASLAGLGDARTRDCLFRIAPTGAELRGVAHR